MKVVILFIISSLRFGGAERQVLDLVNGFSDDFDIHLFSFERGLDQIESLNQQKIRFYNHPRKHKFDLSPALEIAKIIQKNGVSIVHCTNQISLLFGFWGRLLSGRKTKFILALHTTINRAFKYDVFDRILYTPMMLSCDKIITVCANQKAFWAHKYPFLATRLVTIYNGIDTDKYRDNLRPEERIELKGMLKIEEDEATIGVLADFRPEKGHEYAFHALKILLDKRIKMKLLLIGDGERRNYLRLLSDRLVISQNIRWVGYQKDPRKFLSLCDVLLVPSYAESFSLAILEALSMGKPIIATRVGGTSEVVKSGINGFLVESRNAYDIANKLQLFIEDAELRKRLALAARQSVEKRFHVSQMIEKTERLFYEII
jgi:glycosyltransferase involved in cell wall biosynthesis